MSDIFREVDEELRQEQLRKLWRKYGAYVIGGVAAIVLLVGGYRGWQAWDLSQREARANSFAEISAGLDESISGETLSALETMADPGGKDYEVLAAFAAARAKVDNGDREGAVEIWQRLAANSSLSGSYRGVATLFSVIHRIDTVEPDLLRAELAPLLVDVNPYRWLARELLALLEIRSGNNDRARELFREIADAPDAPHGLRTRATQALTVLGEGA